MSTQRYHGHNLVIDQCKITGVVRNAYDCIHSVNRYIDDSIAATQEPNTSSNAPTRFLKIILISRYMSFSSKLWRKGLFSDI
jgi:hypothetical protein